MSEWKKNTFPKCPKCPAEGGWGGHKECPENGNLWIDIQTGTVKCDGCKRSWSLEETTNYCSCGAIFKGGEIWKGMAVDVKRYGHLVWLQKLGITKGSLETEFIGWWKEPNKGRSSGGFVRTALKMAGGAIALTLLTTLFSDNKSQKPTLPPDSKK